MTSRRARAAPTIVAIAAIALLAVVLGLAPAPASADVTFRFDGRGFGHGVGMSQFGARGAALAGLDARQILAHYYRGAEIAQVPPSTVRVRVVEERIAMVVRGSTAIEARTASSGTDETVRLDAARSFRVSAQDGMVEVRRPDGKLRLRGTTLSLTPVGDGLLSVDGRRYRGGLALVSVGVSRVDAVNHVALEHYLAGVLPQEVPASWGDETPAALRAQAIAARSYTLASLTGDGHFDLHADVRSQVYGGAEAEDPRTTAAVRATSGQVLTFGGEVIKAFYFSTSGGRTESVENVFGGPPRPYLTSVPDPYDHPSPYHRAWPDPPTLTARELGTALGLGAPVRSFRVTRRGDSPRVLEARVVTTDGRAHTVTGAQVRRALGLRDTWFTVTRAKMPVGAPISMSASQLRINQRIAQAAVRRVNALRERMTGEPAPAPSGEPPDRVRLTTTQLRINQRISQAAVRRVNALREQLTGEPAPAASGEPPDQIRLSVTQLLINQRISQAAVRRVNRLTELVDARAG